MTRSRITLVCVLVLLSASAAAPRASEAAVPGPTDTTLADRTDPHEPPEILILGSEHMAQSDREYADGPAVKAQVDALKAAVEAFRAREAEFEKGHDLAAILRRRNSESRLEAQERLCEEIMPRLSYANAGRRQTDNYWLRNREMFSNIEETVDRRGDVERILVVVGAGHKYFLDELARKAGWRRVDFLDYLPQGPGGGCRLRPAGG